MDQILANKKRQPGRYYEAIDVCRLASGAALRIPLHVLTGINDGPTLGILTTVHGDETFPLMVVRELLNSIRPEELHGRIAAVPVANPLAVPVFDRQTPEQHGKTDLHEVFPGKAEGNLTQKMAATISTHLLDHVDALVDMHCGGMGGRLQSRADFDEAAKGDVYQRSLNLCRAFGVPFIHSNNLSGTAARYCNSKGVPTVNPEIGGVYLGAEAENHYMAQTLKGFRSVLDELGMLAGPKKAEGKQLLFGVKSRFEVNPSHGGYLQSRFHTHNDLGKRVEKDDLLGQLVDIYSLQIAEELRAPVSGYLFFSRYSGLVDAGTKAFAIAEEATSRWL